MEKQSANPIYKVLSLIMAAAMIFGCLTAFADAPDGAGTATPGTTRDSATSGNTDGSATSGNTSTDDYIVIEFAELPDDVKNQSVPYGTPLEDLILPDTLKATISDGESESKTDFKVKAWQSAPEYDSEIIGTYEFMPVLPKGLGLSDGVELPVITVEVQPLSIAPMSSVDVAALRAAALAGGVYRLSGNITMMNEVDSYLAGFSIGAGKNFILDLNGHTLTIMVAGNSSNGIKLLSGSTFTIRDTSDKRSGVLDVKNIAVSGVPIGYGAGINTTDGSLIIESGTINATGGLYGAGIGNGNEGDPLLLWTCGTIVIKGGKVTAKGGDHAAGIGGGHKTGGGEGVVYDSEIIITGGTVTATGGMFGSGIGGGCDSAGRVTISGDAFVTARGGSNAAGIGGGGFGGSGGYVTINGGTVYSTGAAGAQDIGSGSGGSITDGGTKFESGSIFLTKSSVNGFDPPLYPVKVTVKHPDGELAHDVVVSCAVEVQDSKGVTKTYVYESPVGVMEEGVAWIWLPVAPPPENEWTIIANLGAIDQGSKEHQVIEDMTSNALTIYLENPPPLLIKEAVAFATAPVTGQSPNLSASVEPGSKYAVKTVKWSPDDDPFQANKEYAVSITLRTEDGYKFKIPLDYASINGRTAHDVPYNDGREVTIQYAFTKMSNEIADISVTTQPKLVYISGDSLDLSALVVKLTFKDGATLDNVKFSDFAKYGLVVDPAHGTVLSNANDDKPVKVTYSDDTSVWAVTNDLTVNEPGNTGDAEGTVTENNNPLKDVTVKVMAYGTYGAEIASTLTDDNGFYSFSNLPYGTYSLVASKSSLIVTKMITIDRGKVEENIQMPAGNRNTIVHVKGNTPSVAADNLEAMFSNDDIAQTATASSGVTVTMKLVVERVETPPDKDLIERSLNKEKVAMYLDAKLLKTLSSTGVVDGPVRPPDGVTLTTVVSLPRSLAGNAEYSVVRAHNGDIRAVSSYYNSAMHTLKFEADLFSTYAIVYPYNDPAPAPPSSKSEPKPESSYWIEPPEARTMAKYSQKQGLDYARSWRSTITGIREESLHILAEAGLRYRHDMIEGNVVQIRVAVNDPAKATKDILVSGYLNSDTAYQVKTKFEKMTSSKVAVISMDQQGSFGIKVQIAAKVDLNGMDENNLYFYSYNKKTGQYKQIITEYKIDTKGYLHFLTELAGDIVVSDVPLDRQPETQIPEEENPGTGGDGNNGSVTNDSNNSSNTSNRSDSNDSNTGESSAKVDSHNPSMGGEWKSSDHITNAVIKQNLLGYTRLSPPKGPLLAVIIVILMIAVIMLWALVPRKGDELIPIEDYRSKRF